MAIKVFLSWQSDTPAKIGHRFLADAIKRACAELAEVVIEEADRPELDKDTLGIGSQAEIFKTICKKIDGCSIFIADLTYVPSSTRPRKMPNPNVLIEYGWALKSRTIDRIIWVMNTSYGKPEEDALPFDLTHHRRPISYHLSENSSDKQIEAQSNMLVGILKESIPLILKDTADPAHVERIRPPDVSNQLMGLGSLGKEWDQVSGSSKPVFLRATGGFLSIWMLPKAPLAPKRAAQSLWEDISSGQVDLLPPYWSTPRGMRSSNGIGYFCQDNNAATDGKSVVAGSCAFLSETGQIWGIDKRLLDADLKSIFIHEIQKSIFECAERYLRIHQRIGIKYPIKWVATLSGASGRNIVLPPNVGMTIGRYECMNDFIESEGWLNESTSVEHGLRPFLEEIYHSCGLSMPPATAPKKSQR